MLYRVTELYGKKWCKETEWFKRWENPGLWADSMPLDEVEYIYGMIDSLLMPSPFKYQLESLPTAKTVLRLFCFGDDYTAFRKSLGQLAIYFNVAILMKRTSYGTFWESDDIPGLQIVIHEPQNVVGQGYRSDESSVKEDFND